MAADVLLPNDHHDEPLQTLWEVLSDSTYEGLDLALEIVRDPRCGIGRSALIKRGASQGFGDLSRCADSGFELVATPLTLSAFAGRVDVLQALLAEGDHNMHDTKSFNCLHAAAAVGDVSAIEFLISQGFEVDATDKDGNTPLLWAAKNENVEAIEVLVVNNAATGVVARDGYTPLLLTALNGDDSSMEALIAAESAIDAANEVGETSLHLAAWGGHTRFMETLMDNGAAVDAMNNAGETPLHSSVEYGSVKVLAVVVVKGADINAADEHGNTPLHWAARSGDVPVIVGLVAEGAAVNAVNHKGETPIMLFFTRASLSSAEAAQVRRLLAPK